MTDSAIVVSALGKEYRRGEIAGAFQYEALRDHIADAGRLLMRRLRGAAAEIRPTRKFWALSDVTFEIPRGQVVGIIGRNGAGKSTLLKILARITRPTVGYADLAGRIGSLLEVGTGFHPELTGRENIQLNGAILGMRRAEIARSFDAIVAFSGVEAFLDTPVKRYSSGMYVRLAFAVAAHLQTEILLVDEVLAVGDAQFQQKCLGKMQEVVREGRTILFVSHNMAAVKSLCQRAVWLDGGRLVRDDAVDRVVEAYLADAAPSIGHGRIPDAAPRSGTGEARFRRIEMLDGGGAALSQLYMGDPFSVALTFDVRQPIRDVIVGVGISSFDGVRATSSYSSDGGSALLSFEPGQYRIVLDLDLVLLPRRYTLDVVVAGSDGREIDYVQRVFDFTALDVARDGPDGYPWGTVHGYVRPRGRWHAPERRAS